MPALCEDERLPYCCHLCQLFLNTVTVLPSFLWPFPAYFLDHEPGLLTYLIEDFRSVLEGFEIKHFYEVACNLKKTQRNMTQ